MFEENLKNLIPEIRFLLLVLVTKCFIGLIRKRGTMSQK